jgi:histidyl-tRNA synthetase
LKPSTPKGTRDFSPAEMARRNYIFDTVKAVFRLHGFAQIETPAMENSETLMGKYGEEGDRLIFKILDSGDYLKSLLNEARWTDYSIYFGDFDDLKRRITDSLLQIAETGSQGFDWSKVEAAFTLDGEPFEIYQKLFEVFRPFIEEIPRNRSESRLIGYVGVSMFEDTLRKDIRLDLAEFFQYHEAALKVLRDSSMLPSPSEVSKLISSKALRYDLTVPFARYVVQHRNDLTFPFKRFQIQPVWRADRPQKGRYREFYQCDVDVIGSDSLLNEVELVQIIDSVFGKLNIPVTLKLNNRKLLAAIAQVVGAPDAFVDITVALDKLDKIGEEKVVEELRQRGISDASIEKLLPLIRFQGDTHQKLAFLATFLGENELGQKGIAEVQTVIGTAQPLISSNTVIELDLTLARGLNYYTGAIFEVKSNLPNTLTSTICGGGRYDDLTGIFGLPNVSGVGISFGADRIYDVMLEAGLFPESAQEGTKVLFVNFGEKEAQYCLPLVKQLREAGIATELYPDDAKLKKQFGHADSLSIPFVAMVGDSEMAEGVIGLKDMRSGEQVRVALPELVQRLR